MAFDKKTSMYSDQNAVGSAEELDTYGVWVKSEPQDLAAGATPGTGASSEPSGFESEAAPYESDFDADFDDLGADDADFESQEQADGESEAGIGDIDDDFPHDAAFGFDDDINSGIAAQTRGSPPEEASTQLLMKIADELSSIRTELSSLKKEFAEIRAEGVSHAAPPAGASRIMAEAPHDDFFAGDDEEDEKIVLTGDEMEDFLAAAADFPGEDAAFDSLDYDAQRAMDEAALKELAGAGEDEMDLEIEDDDEGQGEEEEEIEIDFDNLGIDLDEASSLEDAASFDDDPFTLEEKPLALEDEPSAFDDHLALLGGEPDEIPSLEDEDEQEALPLEESASEDAFGEAGLSDDALSEDPFAEDSLSFADSETEAMEFADDAAPFDLSSQHEEIQALHQEGAAPHTPAPENSGYLEEDPFVLGSSGLDSVSLDGEEGSNAEAMVLSESSAEEEMGFDLELDDFSADSLSLSDDEIGAVPIEEEETGAPAEDSLSFADGMGGMAEEEPADGGFSLSDEEIGEVPVEDSLSFPEEIEDIGEMAFGDGLPLAEEDQEIEEETEEISFDEIAEESPLMLEEEALGAEEISFDEPSEETPLALEEEAFGAEEISFDEPSEESPLALEEEAFGAEEISFDEPSGETPLALEEEAFGAEEISFDEPSGESPLALEEEALGAEEISFDEPSGESPLALEEEAFGAEEISFDEPSGESPLALEEEAFGAEEISFDEPSEESPLALEEEAFAAEEISFDEMAEESPLIEEEAAFGEEAAFDETADESPVSLAEEIGDEYELDDMDLSDAVIDEPDLSAGLVETPIEEPVLDNLSFEDDIALDMDDFGAGLDLAPEEVGEEFAMDIDAHDEPGISDGGGDSLAQVIPEGFEVDAEEAAVAVDEDIEALGDDLSIDDGTLSPPSGAGPALSSGLEADLKNVLSYMDHLLESLPEDKIEEFAKSEYFDAYKKIFKELGLV